MNKQELAGRIWKSANTMRSKIEANEYKDYILGLIFYKFLSDKEEQFLLKQGMKREEFAEMLNEGNPDIVSYVQANVGYFIAYENLYSTWLAEGSDFNIGTVRDALNAFARLIAASDQALFKGIFDTLQTGLSKLGDTATNQTKAVRDLLDLIRYIPTDGRQGYDVLGFIYEYLIEKFAANAGKKAGEFYTPHEVSQLMSQIIASHLVGRDEIQIYDPTSGSGSLLLNIGQEVARHMGDPDKIKYFAQELKANTYNLTRMNLVMRGIRPGNIVARNGDSLEQDWPLFDEDDPTGTYRTLYVDAVVSNPPYSQAWTPAGKESDPRFSRFGLAPDSKADYAFLLHDLFHVKPDGIMAIVLPHGVLFRGSSEAEIRKNLIEENHIDAIIGLPEKIFYGTGIPTIVMVLKQRRDNDDVLFIDASQGFKKVGRNNQLRAGDIRRIADVVHRRENVERFARVVTREEIRGNEYNLNIPRYVSATPPAEEIDLYATMYGGVPSSEIDELGAYWGVMPGLRETLFTETNGYGQLTERNVHTVIDEHDAVRDFRALVPRVLDGLAGKMKLKLVDERATVDRMAAGDELTKDVFERFSTVPLVDEYDAYQVLHDQWAIISTDLEMIQSEGEKALREIVPVMVTKKKNKKDVEVQDGWEGRIMPFTLVQRLLLPNLACEATRLSDELASIDAELTQIFEDLSEDDKLELSDVMNASETGFLKGELSKAVKALKKTNSDWADDSIEGIQIRAQDLMNRKTKVAKEQKAAVAELEEATHEAIENLSDDEVDELLIAKWIKPLIGDLTTMPSTVLRRLEQQVHHLHEKYADSIVGLEEQIQCTERGLSAMLNSLTGSAADMDGLSALTDVLGGRNE